MNEITEAIEAQTSTYTWLVMGQGIFGRGQTRDEAIASFREHGGRGPFGNAGNAQVASWDRPVKSVIDGFGRIYWDDPEAIFDWEDD